jgi:hypothetical protein
MSSKERETDNQILLYLKRKGYKAAAAIMQQELARAAAPAGHGGERTAEQATFEAALDSEASITNLISSFGTIDRSPERYDEAYIALRDWIYASLDRYKVPFLSPFTPSPRLRPTPYKLNHHLISSIILHQPISLSKEVEPVGSATEGSSFSSSPAV